MRPLKHGYTNRTLSDGAVVKKTYEGPDAELRLERERVLLTRLRGRLPVPPLTAADDTTLTLGFMRGTPGQELLDSARAVAVLVSCGEVLRRLHDTEPNGQTAAPHEADEVLVHGDFGPHNVLLDPESCTVTAVVDWEFAHIGDPVEDLAWCEWIVRMHHPDQRQAVPHFFRAYGGGVPPWPVRKAAMLARCEALAEFCHRWEPDGSGVRQWRERAIATAAWEE
ncbi:aminoglycoside phosphotransferase family protein [Streptomyces sp. NPDC005483]|uniref:phosphotransferase family protein n=1 Tax=Streptomyces sp. NPDC005483 TaxID=3154882 RepID=UPI0033B27C81